MRESWACFSYQYDSDMYIGLIFIVYTGSESKKTIIVIIVLLFIMLLVHFCILYHMILYIKRTAFFWRSLFRLSVKYKLISLTDYDPQFLAKKKHANLYLFLISFSAVNSSNCLASRKCTSRKCIVNIDCGFVQLAIIN